MVDLDTVPIGTETRAFGHFYKDVAPPERKRRVRQFLQRFRSYGMSYEIL